MADGRAESGLFRNAERRQDAAQHDEGADQRRRAIPVFRSVKDRRDIPPRDSEPRRQDVGGRRVAAEVDVVGRRLVIPLLYRSISWLD
jgi:hypothetical protein